MEFLRVDLGAFGGLRDFDTGPEPMGRLVAVLGPNEAGKTTLFNFLTAMLYGIYPASRDRNPYTPWSGGDIEGGAVLRVESGETWEVRRRLLSSPSGTLTRGTVTEDIRNRTLPCAEHVPLEVFRQVFALTLGDLAGLQGEGWARVQDQLITGMGAKDLASVRVAIEDLLRDAGRIWRPSRVGNQRVRDLRERVRDLRLRRRVAADFDRDLRSAADARTEVELGLREARDDLEACRLFVEGCQRLLPLRDRLRRIEGLLHQAGSTDELGDLPADPVRRLEELGTAATRLEQRLDELAVDAVEPQEGVAAFGPIHHEFLERSRDVRETVSQATGLESSRARVYQLETELRQLDRRCADAARELFADPWQDVDSEAVMAVPVAGLRRALETYRAADGLRSDAAAAHADQRLRGWAWALAALGLLMTALALSIGRSFLAVPGALLLGIGGGLLAVRVGRSRRDGGSNTAYRDPDARATYHREATAEITRMLSGIPVRPELVTRPTMDLAVSVERIQQLLADARERSWERDELETKIERLEADVRGLSSDLGGDPKDVTSAIRHMEEGLREAESVRSGATSARRELDRIEKERETLSEDLAAVRADRDRLERHLARLVDAEDPRPPAMVVRDRLEALDLARRLEDELRREYPDRDELVEQIRRFESLHAGRSVDAAELASAKASEIELEDAVGELTKRLEGLKKDMEYLGREETMGAIDGEIEALRAEMDEQVRARDRLALIAAILQEADRRFRETHQPDVLRRAGCHLSTVTGGRYERILLDESDGGRFLLDGPGYPGPIEVGEPISTGTREQVYLSLRLAILDHLDRRGERLPLVMDEAFVNWDSARRTRAFELIGEVSRARQVFVFTCHDEMAGTLAALGARVLVLDSQP